MAVLTDDGGGVSQLAVVVTSASYAGYFADCWREDHLDPSCVVAHWCRKHGTNQEKGEGEQAIFGYSLIHWKKFTHFQVQARHNLLVRLQSKWQKIYYVICNFEILVMCLLPALISFQLPLSICFSSSSPAPKSSGASETWAGIKKKKKKPGERSQQTKLWDVFQFFIISLWEVDIGIWAYQALFQNRGHATFSLCTCFSCFFILFSLFLSSWFLWLRFSKLCSEPLAPQIKKKGCKKCNGMNSHRDQEVVAVAFKGVEDKNLLACQLAEFFPTLTKASPRYKLTGRRDEWTFNLSMYCTTISYTHLFRLM